MMIIFLLFVLAACAIFLVIAGIHVMRSPPDEKIVLAAARKKNPEPNEPAKEPKDLAALDEKRDALLADQGLMEEMVKATAKPVVYYPKVALTAQDKTRLSFFGGLPLAPADFAWPIDPATNAPIHFMAQIDLAEMPRNDATTLLPDTGVLFFFQNHTYESEPDAVLYYPQPDASWIEITAPSDTGQSQIFPKQEVIPTEAIAFARTDNFYVMDDNAALNKAVVMAWDEDPALFWASHVDVDQAWDAAHKRLTQKQYKRVYNATHQSETKNQAGDTVLSSFKLPQQTGGYADSIQGNYIENAWGHVLLFQTFDDAAVGWELGALLQYWIKFNDLKNGDWDKAFMTMDVS